MWRLELLALAALVGACAPRMDRQRKIKPQAASPLFPDGRGLRPLVAGTVSRGPARDLLLEEGRVNGRLAESFPFPVTRAVLERGRERYEITCAVCHDRAGGGDGMIVRRGFPRPPSFHERRLREAPPGLFVATMANGVGAMFPYADRVEPRDRWAIAAYIRALQLRERFPAAALTSVERKALEAAK